MRIALAGNPNTGKTSLFNLLSGLQQKVGNFPGVTVEKYESQVKLPHGGKIDLIDLPGAYSLYPTSADERVVLNVLSNHLDPAYPDAILYVADATRLENHLLLLTQILDLGIPCALVVSMTDVAHEEGISYDFDTLSSAWQLPVISLNGRNGEGLDAIYQLLEQWVKTPPTAPVPFYALKEAELSQASPVMQEFGLSSVYQALLWVHHFEKLPYLNDAQKLALRNRSGNQSWTSLRHQVDETLGRFNKITPLLLQISRHRPSHPGSLTEKLDQVFTHRIGGPLVFFSVMFLVFQAIFSWAGIPMDAIDQFFAWAAQSVKDYFPETWWSRFLADGVLAGFGAILVFVPQIALLFLLISLLEESGYMARAVFLFDHLLQKVGLNGRSIVGLVSGAACAIPAIMSTRTISNWKERLITILVTPWISCSARIPVYTLLVGAVIPDTMLGGMIGLQGLVFMGLYLLGILMTLLAAWVFKKILKSEEPSLLMLELPDYRRPMLRNVLLTVWNKVWSFVTEAGKIILVISMLIWLMASFGPGNSMEEASAKAREQAVTQNMTPQQQANLEAALTLEASWAGQAGHFIEPALKPLGFDWKIGIALLTSFAAREVFVGTLSTIYNLGEADSETLLSDKLRTQKDVLTGKPLINFAQGISLLLFYVFALQCMSTLAVVKRETGTWKWALVQFTFMTGFAYLVSLLVYQLLR